MTNRTHSSHDNNILEMKSYLYDEFSRLIKESIYNRNNEYLEKKYSGVNYNQDILTIASKNFANQVSSGGSVYTILYYPDMRIDVVWFEEAKELAKRLIDIVVGR